MKGVLFCCLWNGLVFFYFFSFGWGNPFETSEVHELSGTRSLTLLDCFPQAAVVQQVQQCGRLKCLGNTFFCCFGGVMLSNQEFYLCEK